MPIEHRPHIAGQRIWGRNESSVAFQGLLSRDGDERLPQQAVHGQTWRSQMGAAALPALRSPRSE